MKEQQSTGTLISMTPRSFQFETSTRMSTSASSHLRPNRHLRNAKIVRYSINIGRLVLQAVIVSPFNITKNSFYSDSMLLARFRHVLTEYSNCSRYVWSHSNRCIRQRCNGRLEFFQFDHYFIVT